MMTNRQLATMILQQCEEIDAEVQFRIIYRDVNGEKIKVKWLNPKELRITAGCITISGNEIDEVTGLE
jgi:hypothetical protein